MINSKNLEKIDAYFIRNLRISNGDSGENLAEALNINKTYLYYIENGSKNLSSKIFDNVLAYYGVTYDKSIKLLNEAYELTIKTYECIVFKNYDLMQNYKKEFFIKLDSFSYSRGYIFVDLIEAIISVRTDKEASIFKLKNVSKYVKFYDANIAYVYGVVYAFCKGIVSDFEDSKRTIFDIYETYPCHDVLPSVKSMFNYQLGRICFEDKSYLKSLDYYREAIEDLKKIYCIERINQANIEIANVLLKMKLYDEAEKRYLKLLDEAKSHGFKRRMNACLNNLSYIYLLQKKYEECEKYVINAQNNGSKIGDLNYYLAYCAYKTKSKAYAKSIITKLIDDEDDRYTLRMLRLIQAFVNDNTCNIDKFFNIVKKELIHTGDMVELSMVYEMVISYYAKKDTIKCSDYVEQYLKLPKF